MHKPIFTMLLVAASSNAAADWTWVSGNENLNLTVYADLTTIRRSGNMVKMWDLHDYKTVRQRQRAHTRISYLSSKVQREYDCMEERVRVLAVSNYSKNMGEGEVAESESDAGKWASVSPESIGEVLWQIACKKS